MSGFFSRNIYGVGGVGGAVDELLELELKSELDESLAADELLELDAGSGVTTTVCELDEEDEAGKSR